MHEHVGLCVWVCKYMANRSVLLYAHIHIFMYERNVLHVCLITLTWNQEQHLAPCHVMTTGYGAAFFLRHHPHRRRRRCCRPPLRARVHMDFLRWHVYLKNSLLSRGCRCHCRCACACRCFAIPSYLIGLPNDWLAGWLTGCTVVKPWLQEMNKMSPLWRNIITLSMIRCCALHRRHRRHIPIWHVTHGLPLA